MNFFLREKQNPTNYIILIDFSEWTENFFLLFHNIHITHIYVLTSSPVDKNGGNNRNKIILMIIWNEQCQRTYVYIWVKNKLLYYGLFQCHYSMYDNVRSSAIVKSQERKKNDQKNLFVEFLQREFFVTSIGEWEQQKKTLMIWMMMIASTHTRTRWICCLFWLCLLT